MNPDKTIDPKNPIDPTKTTSKGNVELTEEQLGKASGGGKGSGNVKISDLQITKVVDKTSPL